MAYLLGCDYCEGVRGVGVVNALEVLECFDSFFKFEYYLKKWGEFPDLINDWENFFEFVEPDIRKFFNFHRNYKKHWIFPESFPEKAVKEAFFHPELDYCEDFGFYREFGEFKKDEFSKFMNDNFDFGDLELKNYVDKFEKGLKNVKKVNLKSFFQTSQKFKFKDIKSERIKHSIQILKKKIKKSKKKKKRKSKKKK